MNEGFRSQLVALRKALEVDEHRAQQAVRDIGRVVAERREKTEAVRTEYKLLQEQLGIFVGRRRQDALVRGDSAELVWLAKQGEEIRSELKKIAVKLQAREEELKQGESREQAAVAELAQVLVDRKRLDRLTEERDLSERVMRSALEEIGIDELGRRGKRERDAA